MLLRVAHPVMPFITETLWHQVAGRLGHKSASLMTQPFPDASDVTPDAEADKAVEWLKGVITGIRNIRGERQIKPAVQIELLLQGGTDTDRQLSAATERLLERLGGLKSINWIEPDAESPPGSVQLVGPLKVIVPFTDPQEVEIERQRLGKAIDKLAGEVKRIDGKLSNAKFVEKAPADVVDKERRKRDEVTAQLDTLRDQLDALGAV